MIEKRKRFMWMLAGVLTSTLLTVFMLLAWGLTGSAETVLKLSAALVLVLGYIVVVVGLVAGIIEGQS